MLRFGGMAAVGTAGAAVVSIAGTAPAEAAAGAKVVLGGTNDAGTSVTTLTSASTTETLRVVNAADGGAIRAESTGNGAALSVQGVAAFSRSGLFTVPANTDIATFDVPGGLTESSGAVAMTADPNGYLVARAIPDPATGKLTLHMGGRKPVPTKVAWFVFD